MIMQKEICIFFFFFFQAEDGIRDLTVTGVQTCALPISLVPRRPCRDQLGASGHEWHSTRVSEQARVELPSYARGDLEVFVNGIRQIEGRDFRREGDALIFDRSL